MRSSSSSSISSSALLFLLASLAPEILPASAADEKQQPLLFLLASLAPEILPASAADEHFFALASLEDGTYDPDHGRVEPGQYDDEHAGHGALRHGRLDLERAPDESGRERERGSHHDLERGDRVARAHGVLRRGGVLV
jgi:hypothetical protein